MTTLRLQLTEHVRQKDRAGERLFALIEGAADIPSALSESAPTPSLHIVRASDRVSDNEHTETVIDTFQLLLSVRNVRTSSGEDSSDEVERLSRYVTRSLKDFDPVFEEAAERDHRFIHLKRTKGQGRNFADQKLLWVDSYELKYARRIC